MARRKFNYQLRRKSSTNSENRIVEHEHIIKNIERIEEKDTIKIITINGTRCSIVAKSAWPDINWRALWNGLQKGDKIKIKSHAGKIISCNAEVTKNTYIVTEFQKNNEEVIFTLKDPEKEMQVKITESDIDEGKITCEDSWYENLNWSDISYLGYAAGSKVDIFSISERIVFIRFSVSII